MVADDGWLCAGGGLSGRVYLWEVSSGALLRAWDAHYKARWDGMGRMEWVGWDWMGWNRLGWDRVGWGGVSGM